MIAAPSRASAPLRRIGPFLILGFAGPTVWAQEPPPIDAGLGAERLAGVARVWGEVKYFHPALGGGAALDWDAALVAALPEVRAARTREDYSAAIASLLDRLDDPLTRVVDSAEVAAAVGTGIATFDVRETTDRIPVVTVGSYYGLSDPAVHARLPELQEAIGRARAVVFDLRSSEPTDAFGRLQLAGTFAEVQRLLTVDTLVTPGERRRVYYGYESPSVFSSGQYRTGLFVRNGTTIVPAAGARDLRTVFLVNRHGALLPAALPLQAAGKAWIVYEGDLRTHTVGEVTTVSLAEGLVAQVRRAEALFPDGTSGSFAPDLVVESSPVPADGVAAAPGGSDRALGAALELARQPGERRRDRPVVRSVATTRPERAYSAMRYPGLDHRLLAAFRLWNAVEHFYPYKELLEEEWGSVLLRLLPEFQRAKDAREYTLAVAAMARAIQDSHAYVSGPVYNEEVVGAGYPPLRVRPIEGRLIVMRLHDTAAARAAGVRVGDEVVAVDGRPAWQRLEQVADHLSASTPQSRLDRAALVFMNGPVGSTVRLITREAAGGERDLELTRRREDFTTLYHRERAGEVVRVLPGNIGYVDLDRLTHEGVDPMFEALKDTEGIIFDMRGYPRGTVWAIAPRLATSKRPVALFHTPLVGHGSQGPAAEAFFQVVEPAPPEQRYERPTVMLIDERTMSQAEHTGLYLKAANGTRFVGSPTAGANGEVVTIPLPGGIAVGFTGQAVTFPDGTQLQRVGLTPDLEVRPTVAGIRSGRDEVLEAAVRMLTSAGF